MTTTAEITEQQYWDWYKTEPLADVCVDRENVEPGPRFWERMLEAGKQAVADRKEDATLTNARPANRRVVVRRQTEFQSRNSNRGN